MASYNCPDKASQADAVVCRSAALLLRARRKAGVTGEDVAHDVDRLLCAIGLELEADRGSVPTAVRSAAMRLAEHLVQRCSIPVPRDVVGDDEPVGRPQSGRRGFVEAGRGSAAPLARSIRLGRMG